MKEFPVKKNVSKREGELEQDYPPIRQYVILRLFKYPLNGKHSYHWDTNRVYG